MTIIRKSDFIQSIADAFQYISYYHSLDFIQAMHQAYEKEQSLRAKNAIAQILLNSRMAAEGRRPICQDTGVAVVFLRVGMDVQWDKTDQTITEMVNEGVRLAYTNPVNPLRASVVNEPSGQRRNTKDNTPAIVHVESVLGHTVEVTVAAKGFGSEAKAKFAILNPSDSIVDWVLEQIPHMGAGWCPPGILGVGIGGTAEKAMLLAKEALMEPVNIQQLFEHKPRNHLEELRLELYEKINALGIGAQGLGGLTTALDVKIREYPTHAASLPVAIIPNCAATRHLSFVLDGSGPVELMPPSLDSWPKLDWNTNAPLRKVNLDTLTKAEIKEWQLGETLLLSGKLITGRDAAHKKIAMLLERGEPLPEGVDLNNKFIYYVGPVPSAANEIVGPAGPTTATRMDKFTELMLSKTNILGMIGKGERGPMAIDAIKRHQSVSLIAVGGAAYLISKTIRKSRIIAFEELGMEAMREFEIVDMPVTVAVTADGRSIHEEGPKEWRIKISEIKRNNN
ncbi:fumarate hydratase [Legionella jamestowniensis]|uniref:Fumarate hydratase class I n=1 Tax=Legionella jamestowniensis TaxID=455 RepID=A0A0W0V036_9GAMM|nr:fumarate hydratase [Legionella jamestowniensis]KTD13222.1 Fumarate hydratase class I, anaerobic [Legionella jamestowniensis]OCH98259.1 fumarate hydratase [Legionella jamestowniensis]SFL78501.1 fumarase, class I, homodimeric [Legionella jamestowniensis DSM 19215]